MISGAPEDVGPSNSYQIATTTIDQLLGRSVLPIFLEADADPKRLGSCVLVEMLERPFVVTAGHVLKGTRGRPIFVGPSGDYPIALGGVAAFYTSDEHADLDVGVIPLTDHHVSLLSTCTFVPEGAIEMGMQEADHYTVFGYPESNSQFRVNRPARNIQQTTFNLTTGPAAASVVDRLGLDRESHLVLRFEPNLITMYGKKHNPPDPAGISGGPACTVTDRGNFNVKIAAIMTDHRRTERVMIGTRMSIVKTFVRSLMANRLI